MKRIPILMLLCSIVATSIIAKQKKPKNIVRPIIYTTSTPTTMPTRVCCPSPTIITQADVGTTGFTISTAGTYFLGENISFAPASAATAITVASDDVILDLKTFSIKQINATADVNGIKVTSGQSDVKISNGSVENFTADGVNIENDTEFIHCNDLVAFNCNRGIVLDGSSLNPIEKPIIKRCNLIANSTGLAYYFAHGGLINDCTLLSNTDAGIDIQTSESTKVKKCIIEQMLGTGNVYGIAIDGGQNNIFREICINGVESSSTSTNHEATGFLIGSDENALKLEKSQITHCLTTSNAKPYGVKMNYTFPAMSDTGLPNYIHGNDVLSVAWTSDNRYLAIAGDTQDRVGVRVFEFKDSRLIELTNFVHGSTVNSVAWSPDGNYLALGANLGADAAGVRVLAFNGSSLSEAAHFVHCGVVGPVTWSPDGRYLAIGGETGRSGAQVRVLEFTGSSLVEKATYVHGANILFKMSWSLDGKYLAIAGATGNNSFEVRVLEFTGISLADRGEFAHGNTVSAAVFSPDGKYVAIGGLTGVGSVEVRVLEFTGSSLIEKATYAHGAPVIGVSWSPDGNYVAISGLTGIGGPQIRALQFTGSTLVEVTNFVHGATVISVDWSPNGRYLAIGGEDGTASADIRILSALQFPQGCTLAQNALSQVKGPALSAGAPGVSSGRGLTASSGQNLIIKNTAFDNDLNYVFVTDVYRKFSVNAKNTEPSEIDNLSFPPL